MKKIIAISLVAILAVGSVFAAVTLSGEAKGVFSYDIDNKKIGFEAPTTSVKATVEATTAEKVNEGDVYATVKATLSFKAATSKPATHEVGDVAFENPMFLVDKFQIDYAKIVGENWYVGIIGAPAPTDFASSWEYNEDDDVRVNYKVADLFAANPAEKYKTYGVEVGVYDYVAGVTMDLDFNEGGAKNIYGTLTTPEYTIIDGLTAQAGATLGNYGNVFMGFGGKVAYANDVVTADVAGDFGFVFVEDDTQFKFDVAANVAYAPVTANFYYASIVTSISEDQEAKYNGVKVPFPALNIDDDNSVFIPAFIEDYLSIRAVADLNTFDIPVKFTVLTQDLVNTQYFDIAAAVTAVENLTITANGGYWVDYDMWHVGAGASYAIDKVGTVAGGLKLAGVADVDDSVSLGLEASLTNTTLVSGATLKLAYESGDLLADDPVVGKISASAQIKF